jgi:hypothetical protein
MSIRVRASLILGLCLLLAGCATIGPPQPPSLELPKPPIDLRATRKGDKVLLAWTVPAKTMDRQAVRYLGKTRICRGIDPALNECGSPVGEAAPNASSVAANKSGPRKVAATYTDLLPASLETNMPTSYATYAIEALNTSGRGAGLSNQVRVPLARTLPPPPDLRAQVTAQGVVLDWRSAIVAFSDPTPVAYVYRVSRRTQNGKPAPVGDVAVLGKTDLSLIDANIEWEQTYYYHVEAVTVIPRDDKAKTEIEGEDSPEVKVLAHDVFSPAVPAGLQAVFSGPGQKAFIDLIWAPVTDVDLAGYNIYRHEAGAASVRVNSDLSRTPAYRDTDVISGKSYLYSISAVDLRGNESARSEEAGESVP